MSITVRKASISLLLLTVVSSLANADSIYRAIGSDGQPVYSDRPLDGYEEVFELDVRHSSADAIKREQAAKAETTRVASIRESQDSQLAGEAADEAAAAAAQNAANCEAAKARAEKYNSHRKLYKPLPNGEREYLSDEELDAARAEAASTVAEWCN